MNNVVDLVARLWVPQKSSDISLSREQRSATVHKLTSPSPVFHVYKERLTAQDIHADEFFSILLDRKTGDYCEY